jgi:3D (Asp-Asp-Asp) domain-containing protein/peptidoglycan hydrolase CwlO-like protein
MQKAVRLLVPPLLAVLAASAAAAGPGDGLRERAAGLRAQEHATLLELYALDSRLDSARVELYRARGRVARIRARQADVRGELRVARRTLATAQRRLGRSLVALYEDDQRDPVAVVLGATSLTAALDALDRLTQVASSHAEVAAEARRARVRIGALAADLRKRAAEATQLEAQAEARARELARAGAERTEYLARVRAEGAALADRIAAVDARAHAAEARAVTVAAQAAAGQTSAGFAVSVQPKVEANPPPSAPRPPPPPAKPAPVQAAPSGAQTLTVIATAYSLHGSTATGIPAGYGVVAVDPTVIPLGTRMSIPGYGEGVAADTGPGVVGAAIDVWVPTEAQAEAWGTKTLTITLH